MGDLGGAPLDRITPACTGSTGRWAPAPTMWRDHPRVYGEHSSPIAGSRLHRGSPPRVRGAPLPGRESFPLWRITPACTGSTAVRTASRVLNRDHPRVYGEHTEVSGRRPLPDGSPPRVRGAPASRVRRPRGPGITPACTGSTPGTTSARRAWTDHPRVYGEHRDPAWGEALAGGSPPRVRGAQNDLVATVQNGRITPACTGSTPSWTPGRTGSADHPRVYGEHFNCSGTSQPEVGSPPRVRGARTFSTRRRPRRRITPACTGSTRPSSPKGYGTPDHPRVYGEHARGVLKAAPFGGSPPRVRGAHDDAAVGVLADRITPACTGSTRRSAR